MAKLKQNMVKLKIIKNANLASTALLATISLALLQVISWTLTKLLGFETINFGPGFMLILIVAAVIFPFVIMDASPKRTFGEIIMVIAVIGLDILFLTKLAPTLLPTMFTTFNAATPQLTLIINSILGI